MKKGSLLCALAVCMAVFIHPAAAIVLTCDVDGDSAVDAKDVQLCINRVLNLDIQGEADVNGDDKYDAADVQLVINVVLRIDPDSDRDGLSDFYEAAYDGDGSTYNPYHPVTNPTGGDLDGDVADTDGDGVPDGIEIAAGTDPLDPGDKPEDTDGDGLYDPIEVMYGTNAQDADSDDDGLSDGDEVYTYLTFPTNPDSDGDGLLDGDEVDTYGTDPNAFDTDGDGLLDGDEINTYGTDPADSDTDNDGLSDGQEVVTYGTDATNADSDSDGLDDGDEVDLYGSNPLSGDTDTDGVDDGVEVNTYGSDPTSSDSDGDQLPDGWEVTYSLDPTSDIGDDGAGGNPDGDVFTNLDEYTNGTDPRVFDGGGPPEDFSGTWVGTYQCTSSDAYPVGSGPEGYVIATIAQTGADVDITFPVGTGGLTGTVVGDTMLADGTLWMGNPASVSLTISGTQITGTYQSTAHGGTDIGDFNLTLVTESPAQVQAGEWYGSLADTYDSEGCPTEMVLFSDIETPATGEIVMNLKYMELEDPDVVFEFPGVIESDVFAVILDMGTDVTYLSGAILSDDHVVGTYESQWDDGGVMEYEWGEFAQRLSPGPQIDLNGVWRIDSQDICAADPETGTFDVTFVQSDSSVSAVEDDISGEVRGNMFVLLGENSEGILQRIDGEMDLDTGDVSGTYEGEDTDDDEWWYGTYEATPVGNGPAENFAGTWIGTYETTDSDSFPSYALPTGYVIAYIDQTDNDVTITFPVGSGGLSGTVAADTLTATGTLWNGDTASVELTMTGSQITGTFESEYAGYADEGTFDLELATQPPADVQTGKWYGPVEDMYDSEGEMTHNVMFTTIERPSSSDLVVNIEYFDPTMQGIVFPLEGTVVGDVFMCMLGTGSDFMYLTGTIHDDEHVTGYAAYRVEGEFGWSEFEQWRSPGAEVDVSGAWRMDYHTVYSDDPESGSLDLTFTQAGSTLSIIEVSMTGEVRGSTFVLVGTGPYGDPMRIDGEMNTQSDTIGGTFEGEDDVGWYWGTYTAQRR